MNIRGCQSMIAPVERVLLLHVRDAWGDQSRVDAQWRAIGFADRPDFARACEEYDHFVALLRSFGVAVERLPRHDACTLDAIYVHDPIVLSERGAIVGNMGKPTRVPEVAALRRSLEQLGVTIAGQLTGATAKLESGDVLWIDERTLAIGQGFRTNAEGIAQLRGMLGDAVDEIVSVPLPHWNGPDDCVHLMSLVNLIDRDLAVVYPRLLPVPFLEWLRARGIRLIDVPDAEYLTAGPNVLAIAPRACVMTARNPLTQRALEHAGAQVSTFDGTEICAKGGGGPTCLVLPIQRAPGRGPELL
jgi:N-dimethylarginine dimethylaminohydrolase